jgi:CTP:molybdopterin cytidylyltransferase MocA
MIAAVVLAAGAATRFGAPKQRLLLPEVLERVRASDWVADVVVVLGAHDVTNVAARVTRCPDWERGAGASLRCGLRALSDDVEAALVVLADGPDLDPRAIDRVAERWHDTNEPVVAAEYTTGERHPVIVAREVWDSIPDEGARGLDAMLVDCRDLTPPGDVDFADQIPQRFNGMDPESRKSA